jgi:hypothetical protein
MKKYWLFSLLLLAGCSVSNKTTSPPFTQLRLVHKYIVPYNRPFNGTTIGGLSGIDYDAGQQQHYLICDDRSDKQPARFYTARLTPDSIQFTGVTSLRMPDGNVYPATKNMAPDPEALRYNTHDGKLYWSSEGERIVDKDTVLKDPGVYAITKDGHFIDSFPLPSQFHMQADNHGPRRNGTFEGLGLTPDGRYLFVNLEEPRYEDGPRAGFRDTTAWIRILKYDLKNRKPVAQYAYKLAPVAHMPDPANQFYINGIADILVLSDNKLLILERSFSVGVKDCTIRIYVANLEGATDISRINSLQENSTFTPAGKTLLFNFDSLHTYVDNVEGMTFGPRLPNGHRSMIFVADNNFSAQEETQFYVFDVE